MARNGGSLTHHLFPCLSLIPCYLVFVEILTMRRGQNFSKGVGEDGGGGVTRCVKREDPY